MSDPTASREEQFGYLGMTIPELRQPLEEAGYRSVRRVDQPNTTRIMYLADA